MPLLIRKVRSAEDAERLYRHRYTIYVEELGRTQAGADHEHKQIREPLDDRAHTWVALDGDEIVGSVRMNYAHEIYLGVYESLYEMRRVGSAHPGRTSVTTKLMVSPQFRGTPLATRLALSVYRQLLRDGSQHDFIDVYPNRVSFFTRLGYHVHVPETWHPEFGNVIVMRLDVWDEAHLRLLRSPFFRALQKHKEGTALNTIDANEEVA